MMLQAVAQVWDLFDGERIIGHVERGMMGYTAHYVDEPLAGYWPTLPAAIEAVEAIASRRERV